MKTALPYILMPVSMFIMWLPMIAVAHQSFLDGVLSVIGYALLFWLFFIRFPKLKL